MLELRAVEVAYGAVQAVRGIDLDVGERGVVALLGPNGAGKTSTLRAISQLEKYSGTISFDGDDLRGKRPDAVSRAGLVHVPEGRHVFPTLSVHENLLMGVSARGGRTPSYSFDDVYDLFPTLAPLRKRAGYALSGGEQQMVAIGRGLVAAPRLLLLDEPSLGLAPIVTKVVFEVLATVSERTPMMIVEQNTTVALSACDHAYVLVSGVVGLSGTSDELSDRDELLASFLGQHDAMTSP